MFRPKTAGPTDRILPAVTFLLVTLAAGALHAQSRPLEFTRMVAHWANYADDGYLSFIDDAKPELVQVGFYGAHFWSLADTPHGSGYPAHLPVQGHVACGDWFERLNSDLHKRGAKVVGHINVKFLVGDPDSEEGPRGFFEFYKDWDRSQLGPRPTDDPLTLLEHDHSGQPISADTYKIGGMREYWACLNNPAWREVLKRWVRSAVRRGLDGFIVNYFYRHDCHCSHCVDGFRKHLRDRFSDDQLQQLGINDLDEHKFDEIGAWHDPARSTPLRLQALRFSQMANQRAFTDVFTEYGRNLKPDLILAQWNHLGNFTQINGDERCLLPPDQWATDEDYLWYSTGAAANSTDLITGKLGEATLQARYIRGASGNKPFTLGKYENVRIRTAIAELAANGGCPMGFYTRFGDPHARREIVRYYQFLHANDRLYRDNQTHAEALLLFPRSRVHAGDVAAVERFKKVGRHLLDQHVLFDVTADDVFAASQSQSYELVVDPSDTAAGSQPVIPSGLSRFDAPLTTRVSASRPSRMDELTYHFVNYNRQELPDKRQGAGIQDEKPIAARTFPIDIKLPSGRRVKRVEFLTPEAMLPQLLGYNQVDGRLKLHVPPFLVYGVLRVYLDEATRSKPAVRRRIAGLVTEYRHNSHADIILSRLLQTDTLDGRGQTSPLELVSLYVDQRPESDTSGMLAASHGFRLSPSIADALTLGTDRLAVDGVLLIAEHGDYPRSSTTNIQYPKRRFWEETLAVFRNSQRVVPVFIDKHLADNWQDAKFIYDAAQQLKVPLMAGSSLPVTWRRPAADVRRGAPLKEIVAITYHTTDAYGFHALEFAQALAEQRRGGETGIQSVQTVSGDEVWTAFEKKEFDVELFDHAWHRLTRHSCQRDELSRAVKQPRLLRIHYADGLRLHLLELNGAAGEWSAAWRYGDDTVQSSLLWTQEGRPGMHFTYLLNGIEQMVLSGRPTWNVERTLMTSGALDALLISVTEKNRKVETPYLRINYQPTWRWQEPAFPPPMRPWSQQ